MRPVRIVKKVLVEKCQVHPDAEKAYIYTSQLRFQLKPAWASLIQSRNIFMPYAIEDANTGRFHFFANWQPLLPQFDGEVELVNLLVWETPPCLVEEFAWQFVAGLLAQSVHRKSVMNSIVRSLDRMPLSTKERLPRAKRLRSSKSLTSFYCGEARSPVRTQCRKTKFGRDLK